VEQHVQHQVPMAGARRVAVAAAVALGFAIAAAACSDGEGDGGRSGTSTPPTGGEGGSAGSGEVNGEVSGDGSGDVTSSVGSTTDDGGAATASTAPPAPVATAAATTSTTAAPTTTSTTLPRTTTTTIPIVTEGALVLVANATEVDGAAGALSETLRGLGFAVDDATNAAGYDEDLAISKIYVRTGLERSAESVSRLMGGIEVFPMPTPAPVVDAMVGLGDANLLVMLGEDLAGKPLPGLPA